jgi:hypothetical protein
MTMDEQTETTPETPEVEAADRKGLLEAQFEAAERGDDVTPSGRDEKGRFASRATQVESPATQPEPAEEPVWSKPPASWKKDYHDVWMSADPKMREYAWQREEQMRKGVEPLLSKAQFADAMNQALEPYLPTIQGLGLKPEQAVAALAQADYTLRTAPADQRYQYLVNLAAQYGINLNATGQTSQQPQTTVDPLVWQLQNELNSVRGEVMGWKQQQEMAENQTLLSEINSFADKAEHFEEARPTMIQLLQSGVAETLEDAYDKAIRLNEDLFNRVQSARQAEVAAKQAQEKNRAAKAARAAAVSVRGSTPGTNTAPKAHSRRAMLEEAFEESSSRL